MKFLADIEVEEGLKDSSGDLGSNGQVLSSTGSGTNWIDATGGIGGSITDNQIAVGASTANNIEGSSGFTWDGSLLDVDGDAQLDSTLRFISTKNKIFVDQDNGSGFDFYLNNIRVGDLNRVSTSAGQWLIYQFSSGNNAKQFPGYSFANNTSTGMFLEDTQILAFSTAGESRLIIGATGDVGIGTGVDAATQRLHVVGNARVTGAYYDSSGASGSPGTSGQVLSSTGSGTAWVNASGGGGGIGGSITAGQVAFGDTTNDEITGSSALTFTSSNTLKLDNGGSTGSTPNLVLNKGAFGVSKILMQNAGTTKLEIECNNSDDSAVTASGRLTLTAGGASPHVIMSSASSSKVGIGVTLPKSKLQVAGGIQMADDGDTASQAKAGTLKYYNDSGASYLQICMQVSNTGGLNDYAWVTIIKYDW